MASLIYSYYHLNKTQSEVSELRKEIIQLNSDRAKLQQNVLALQNEQKSLNDAVGAKKKQYDVIKSQIEKVESSFEENNTKLTAWLGIIEDRVYEIQAFADLVQRRPGASYLDQRYQFTIRIWTPDSQGVEEVTDKIERVDYFFNSPTFREPHKTITDPSGGFAVDYTGWGCVPDVKVEIRFKNGETRTKQFNMCDQLPGIPTK